MAETTASYSEAELKAYEHGYLVATAEAHRNHEGTIRALHACERRVMDLAAELREAKVA